MPRILRLINRFCLEGPVHNAVLLSKHLANSETLVIAGPPFPHERDSRHLFLEPGIKIIEIPGMGRSFSPLNDFETFRRVKRLIRDFKPEIIHSHCFSHYGLAARLAAFGEENAVKVHTFHGHSLKNASGKRNKLQIAAERYLAKKTDAFIAISHTQKQELVYELKIFPEEKAHIIALGLDLGRFQNNHEHFRNSFREKNGIAKDEIAIGIVARLSAVKNHRLFIDTIELLRKGNPHIRGIIIGDGELKSSLMKYAADKNLYDRNAKSAILFTSWIDKPEEVLPALDLFMLTSLSEGTPLSLIEAQASGIPVISTDAGAVRDCVIQNETGIVVDEFSAEALNKAASIFILQDNFRKESGMRAAQFIREKYDYTQLITRVEALYENLLSQLK